MSADTSYKAPVVELLTFAGSTKHVVEAASGASGVMSIASCVAVDSSAAPPAAVEVKEEGAGVPAETPLCALISEDSVGSDSCEYR